MLADDHPDRIQMRLVEQNVDRRLDLSLVASALATDVLRTGGTAATPHPTWGPPTGGVSLRRVDLFIARPMGWPRRGRATTATPASEAITGLTASLFLAGTAVYRCRWGVAKTCSHAGFEPRMTLSYSLQVLKSPSQLVFVSSGDGDRSQGRSDRRFEWPSGILLDGTAGVNADGDLTHSPDYPTASQTCARLVPERLLLHTTLTISPLYRHGGGQV